MEKLHNFISQIRGSSSVSCIVSDKEKLENIEKELVIENFILCADDNQLEILLNKEVKIFVPLYRLEKKDSWVQIISDYNLGQININKSRINLDYAKNTLLVLCDKNKVEESKEILDQVGLTEQI